MNPNFSILGSHWGTMLDHVIEAMNKMRESRDAVQRLCPHLRDYLSVEEQYQADRDEYLSWLARIDSILKELEAYGVVLRKEA